MNIYFLLFFTFICSNLFCDSFSEIKSAVDRLPYLRESEIGKNIAQYDDAPETIFGKVPGAHLATLDTATFFDVERQFFCTLEAKQASWISTATPEGYFDVTCDIPRQHYTQKVTLPAGTKILMHGDLHGDVHSLVTTIAPYMKGDDGFKLKENIYLAFLGDFVEKGLYGLECIYICMRLKIDNPDNVFLVRGNHEDRDINSYYGFQQELATKGFTDEQIAAVYRLYDMLPSALYVGTNHNYVQLCHGGLDIGYLPTELLNSTAEYQWITELNRLQTYLQLSQQVRSELDSIMTTFPDSCRDHVTPVAGSSMYAWVGNEKRHIPLGLLWTDFAAYSTSPTTFKPHRGHQLSKQLTTELLALINRGPNKLLGIFRAHQHTPEVDNPLMRLILNLDHGEDENKGIAKLWSPVRKTGSTIWPNIVVTFNLSPDTLFGPPNGSWPGFDFDTLGELTTAKEYSDWTLKVHSFNEQKDKAHNDETSPDNGDPCGSKDTLEQGYEEVRNDK